MNGGFYSPVKSMQHNSGNSHSFEDWYQLTVWLVGARSISVVGETSEPVFQELISHE